jgi:hypothetical protein
VLCILFAAAARPAALVSLYNCRFQACLLILPDDEIQRFGLLKCLIQQLAQADVKISGQLFHHADGGVSSPAFQVADISPVDSHLERELLLAEPLLGAQPAKIGRETLTDIHETEAAGQQTIDLQTISHICALTFLIPLGLGTSCDSSSTARHPG